MLNQDHRCICILNHKGRSIERITWINRDVGSARFDRGINCQHHLNGSFEVEAHRNFGADAQLLKMPGELIGTLVQLQIGQRLLIRCYCDGVRSPLNLLGKNFVKALVVREFTRSLVPTLLYVQGIHPLLHLEERIGGGREFRGM